jgi:hypothetical protein
MFTIYKVTATIYDYWYDIDRDGYTTLEKFFSSNEKAEKWIADNSKLMHGFNSNIAEKDYQMPKFKIDTIEVE